MKKIGKQYAAFSLIEVMFSIVLVSTGMLSVIALAGSSMLASADARNQLIAVELAQEGVELVRNIRDNNWQKSLASFNGIDDNNNCRIDKDSTAVVCGSDTSLYTKNGFYVHSSTGVGTKFRRKLIVQAVTADTRRIISLVSWNNVAPTSVPACDLDNKCVYAEVTLSTWGK